MAVKGNQPPQDQDTNPDSGPNVSPATRLLNKSIDEALDARGIGSGGDGGHIGGMTTDDSRLGNLEKDVSSIKGALDWAKVGFALLGAVTLGGVTLVVTLMVNLSTKFDSIPGKITEEFRAQRLEQAAQVSAISNAISATKQQAPQVLLIPEPAISPSISTQMKH